MADIVIINPRFAGGSRTFLFIYAPKKATHYHHAEVARSVTAVDPKTGALSDAGRLFSRMRKTAPEKIAG